MKMHRREILALLAGLPLAARGRDLGAAGKTRIAFGSCCEQWGPQTIWAQIKAKNPEAFLFLGDNIYADSVDPDSVAKAYEAFGARPEFRKFRDQIPVYATWDDHDFGLNDMGAEHPNKMQSKELMLNFFEEPTHSDRRQREGVYESYMIKSHGRRVHVILLDLRWFKEPLGQTNGAFVPQATANPAPLLGVQQWAWLEAELRRPSDFLILGSSIQFLRERSDSAEKWAMFPQERARMIALLDSLKTRNFVILSGDMHFAELSLQRSPAGKPIYELTSSGLNRFSPENVWIFQNSNRLAAFGDDSNFGMVTIDWSRRQVLLNAFNSGGQAVIQHVVEMS